MLPQPVPGPSRLAHTLGLISSRKVMPRIFLFLCVVLFLVLAFKKYPHHTKVESVYTQDAEPQFKTRLEAHLYSFRDFESTKWAPMAITECTSLTPKSYAPCIASSAGLGIPLYAEELVYPDFDLPLPVFANQEDKNLWITWVQIRLDRATYRRTKGREWLEYKGQRGQNFVLYDVEFTPPAKPDSWDKDACMGSEQTLKDLGVRASAITNGEALIAYTPDSWSFQHFLDRATHVVTQAAHLATKPKILTGYMGKDMVNALWDRMDLRDRVHASPATELVSRLIWSCRTVLIHPYLSWKTAEMMQMPWASGELYRRHKGKILYMSRSVGETADGGREIKNEAFVLAAIAKLLEERGRGEELEVFNPNEYTLDELVEYCSGRVSAIIGPHGGAIMNHRFAGPETLVLEFFPSTRIEWLNYEEATILGQTYAVVIGDKIDDTQDDFNVDPQLVVSILRDHLGVKRNESVQLGHAWAME